MACLLLCIQTLKTCLLTPTWEQNWCSSCSSCFWIFHPSFSANSIILSFCCCVNLVLNLFFEDDDESGGCCTDDDNKFPPPLWSRVWNMLRSSLEDSAGPDPPKPNITGWTGPPTTPWRTWWECGEWRMFMFLLFLLRTCCSSCDSSTTPWWGSFLWKLRWHSQAAHLKDSGVPSSPFGMNSPHPSVTWPPMLAAWFFRHSRYLNNVVVVCGCGWGGVVLGGEIIGLGSGSLLGLWWGCGSWRGFGGSEGG